MKDGYCVPATAPNVFGSDRYTPGRAPPPNDYSCESKQPTGTALSRYFQLIHAVIYAAFAATTNDLVKTLGVTHTQGFLF